MISGRHLTRNLAFNCNSGTGIYLDTFTVHVINSPTPHPPSLGHACTNMHVNIAVQQLVTIPITHIKQPTTSSHPHLPQPDIHPCGALPVM